MTASPQKSLDDFVNVQFYQSTEVSEQTYLGEVNVAWKACTLYAKQWYISKEFSVVNSSFKFKQVEGYVPIQMMWDGHSLMRTHLPPPLCKKFYPRRGYHFQDRRALEFDSHRAQPKHTRQISSQLSVVSACVGGRGHCMALTTHPMHY